MLDYRMETFITLCKTMNYRLAAQALNITQPAVTQHIRYLEDYYGCRLFSYDRRRLSMTPQAEILLRYVQTQNYQEQKLVGQLQEKRGHRFAIGTTKTIGKYVIARQIKRFLEDPGNTVSVETDNTMRILELLDQGKLDFALVEGYFDQNTYAHRLYRVEPFVGFCSISHPFAGKTVSLQDFLQETVIVREQGSGTRSILEKLLQLNNVSLQDCKRVISIGSLSLLEQLVASDAGVTFAYQAVGKQNALMAQFHVEGLMAKWEFNYVFLPDTDAEAAVEIFDRYR